MLVPRKESRPLPAYSFPSTKLRNVVCVQCKHRFFLTEFVPLRGAVPLLLQCGHVICETCAKSGKSCPRCPPIPGNQKSTFLPLNMYAMGLLIVSHNHANNEEETDFSFSQSTKKSLKQPCAKDLCYECGIRATIKCPQCIVLFCHACYAKIHGRALQSHTKVMLSESRRGDIFNWKTTCSDTCTEPLTHYCNDCEVATCAHCLENSHAEHSHLFLRDKNHDFLPEFFDAANRVSECLGRIRQSQKKLNTISKAPADWEKVETTITDHFAQLHGVLQNVEGKLIDSLYRERENRSKNLESLAAQLESQEELLQTAFTMSGSIADDLQAVDVNDAILKLKDLANVPCHVLQNIPAGQQQTTFHVDKTIIESIEKHCSIEVPPMAQFSIVRKDMLPKDYEIEPLTQEISVPSKINFPTAIATPARNLPALPSTSLLSIKPSSSTKPSLHPPKTTVLSEGSSEFIRVTHIVDPSWFYVQRASASETIIALDKMLATAGVDANDPPSEITPDKLYIVQSAEDGKWYRGRIKEKRTTTETGETYRVFLIDYGREEENVSVDRMRNINPQYATLPVMAFRCALFGVVPPYGKWQPAATSAFKKIVNNCATINMQIHVLTGDTYYVDVSAVSPQTPGRVCVANSLIMMGYASRVTTHKLMRMNPTAVRTYFNDSLDIKKYATVEYLFATSPDSIYVCRVPGHLTHFKKLIENMTEEYTRELSSSAFIHHQPEKGLPCAALGSDGYWYRCVISREPTDGFVTVFYVDLGYEREIRFEEIRAIPKKFMSTRTRAIKIKLRDVKPLAANNGKWSAAARNFTKEILTKTSTFEVIPFEKSDDAYNVTIYLPGKVDFAYQLAKMGHAQYTKSSNVNVNKKMNRRKKKYATCQKNTDSTEESEAYDITTVKDDMLSKENEDPFKICVSIELVKSPDCIYVAIADRQEAFLKLKKEMKNFYTHNRSEKHDKWVNGAVCAVYSAKDKCYCRAKILEIKSPKEVVVFFYDMGIEDTVTIENIYPLRREYTESPTYVFKVRLAGILPCGGSKTWTLSSCRELGEIISINRSCKFYISKLEEEEDIENTGVPIELWIKQTKMDGPLTPTRIEINSINRMLVEKGFALPIKDYAKKRDQILATELQRQVEKRLEIISRSEMSIQWHEINNELNNGDSTEVNTDVDTANTISTNEKYDSVESLFSDVPLPPKLAAWIPPAPITEEQFKAIPTNLDIDGFLYLHTKKQHRKIMKIERQLEEYYKNATLEPCDKEWAPGDMCIAQYHANKKWYRGKVLRVLENDIIEVQFVDYGNIEECPIGTLKKKVLLGHTPILCTKCAIWGLEPASADGNWDTCELDKIHSLLVEKECEVNVVDKIDGELVISITLLPNDVCVERYDLISFLINELKMNIVNPYTKNKMLDESISDADTADVVIEHDESISTISDGIEELPIANEQSISILHEAEQDETNKDLSDLEDNTCTDTEKRVVLYVPPTALTEKLSSNYRIMVIPLDIDFIEISVSCCVDQITFLAQLQENEHSTILNSYHTQYDLMMKDLQENAIRQPMITSLAPNTPCCAKFVDSIWYRCLITESECIQTNRDTKIKIKLIYVDFGNEEYKTVDCHEYELYSLKPEWFDVPIMSKKCRLWNIEVARAGDDLNMQIQDLYSKPVLAKIIETDEEFLNVELYEDKECTELAYRWLIEEGFFRSTSKKANTIMLPSSID